jgi:hypothetical protein
MLGSTNKWIGWCMDSAQGIIAHAGLFLKLHLVYDQTQGSGAVFFLTLQITLFCVVAS